MDVNRLRRSSARRFIFNVFARPIRKFLYLGLKSFAKTDHYFNFHLRRFYPPIERVDSDLEKEIDRYLAALPSRLAFLPHQPKISIVLPVYNVPPRYLVETLASITSQVYDNWEVCVVDDHSESKEIDEILWTFSKAHPKKFHIHLNDQNEHISLASNRAIEMATGEYIALLDHDDRLTPNALAEIVRAINVHDKPEVLYSDEGKIDENGWEYDKTFFKPGWSPYFHLHVNYTTHLSVYATSLVRELGGFRAGYEGAQDHDLMLRAVEKTSKPVVHVPFALYQWRAITDSTADSVEAKPYFIEAGRRSIQEACERRGKPAQVEFDNHTQRYRVHFELPKESPLVSIVIPTKDAPELIRQCVDSIFAMSTYKNFELRIVDNGSQDPGAVAYLQEVEKRDNVEVFRDERPFNFARMNNEAVARAAGQYVVLLNNDTEVITPGWIEELLQFAQHDDVATVGCKLLYPDQSVQHAGLVGCGHNIAAHGFKNKERENTNYFNYLRTPHEVFGNTMGCLMVKKSLFVGADGLDEAFIPNGYGDVEFCMSLSERGLRHIYTPHAELFHHESPSRGKMCEMFERIYMRRKYGGRLVNDPHLHPYFVLGEHYDVDPKIDPVILSNRRSRGLTEREAKRVGLEKFLTPVK